MPADDSGRLLIWPTISPRGHRPPRPAFYLTWPSWERYRMRNLGENPLYEGFSPIFIDEPEGFAQSLALLVEASSDGTFGGLSAPFFEAGSFGIRQAIVSFGRTQFRPLPRDRAFRQEGARQEGARQDGGSRQDGVFPYEGASRREVSSSEVGGTPEVEGFRREVSSTGVGGAQEFGESQEFGDSRQVGDSGCEGAFRQEEPSSRKGRSRSSGAPPHLLLALWSSSDSSAMEAKELLRKAVSSRAAMLAAMTGEAAPRFPDCRTIDSLAASLGDLEPASAPPMGVPLAASGPVSAAWLELARPVLQLGDLLWSPRGEALKF